MYDTFVIFYSYMVLVFYGELLVNSPNSQAGKVPLIGYVETSSILNLRMYRYYERDISISLNSVVERISEWLPVIRTS